MEKKYDSEYDSWNEAFEELCLTCLIAFTVLGSFLYIFIK